MVNLGREGPEGAKSHPREITKDRQAGRTTRGWRGEVTRESKGWAKARGSKEKVHKADSHQPEKPSNPPASKEEATRAEHRDHTRVLLNSGLPRGTQPTAEESST